MLRITCQAAGKPEIMNTDQGSQFTGAAWTTTWTEADIKISMPLDEFPIHLPVTDGRGRYLDNIFPNGDF